MPPLPVKDGLVSVYQVLSHLGISHPGKAWKRLVAACEADLPEYTRKQFDMADGRKSRLLPAIHVEDVERFTDLVRGLMGEHQTQWFYLPAERQVLDILGAAFQDQHPESPFVLGEAVVDMYFHTCKVAVMLLPPGEKAAGTLQPLDGVRVLQVKLHHQDFKLGEVVAQLRQMIDLKVT